MNIAQKVSADAGTAKHNALVLSVAQAFGGANAPIVISLGSACRRTPISLLCPSAC